MLCGMGGIEKQKADYLQITVNQREGVLMDKEALKQQIIDWRHYLHQHPECAFEEVNTAAFVTEKLCAMGIDVETGVGKTGVVGTLKVGDGKRVIGLRADMDCICLQEMSEDLPYKSQTQNRMHACGHDGHTATLLGAAKILSESKDFSGTVRFVFQPAEEPGWGAKAMIDDGFFKRFPVDEMYGLHNMPQYRAGTIAMRAGGIMASEDNFTIQVKGKGGHASAPDVVKDPLVTASEIVCALQTIVSRNITPTDTAVVSCTEFVTDGAHNAIPSNVVIKGDCRSFTPEVSRLIESRMRTICEHICRMNGVECEFTYTHEFAPTFNWEENTKYVVEAAKAVVGVDHVVENCQPLMSSEDFGQFIQEVPGCFVFLGNLRGNEKDTPLHNSHFDYNDDLLLTGAEFFAELVRQRLPK